MSTVDLSALPPPEVLESLDFEDAYQEELSVFRTYMGDNWNATLESDPVVKLLELGAYRRLQTRARINDGAKALLLAYAQRTDLDQLAANVRLKRLVVQEANALSVPPVPKVMELDDALRERIQLVYEGLTTAGPRNSYILHARNASALVADAQAESPSPAHVVVTVLHLEGNGVADQTLLDKVHNHLSDEDIRPVGDRLTVQSAEVQEYRIDAVLHMAGTGSENEAILAEATRRLAAWINPRRRLGVEVPRSAVDAQLHITGVSRVDLSGWQDIPRAKHQAAYCTGYSVIQGGTG
ncbi:baseplate assembly protein [Pseudomonas sp. FSL R10-0765]|uniref:Putative baseplate assembly protein n=1 Tax=uncultured Caudovirales phage TaxID=2100421 RepID=A0A2H4JFK9_9CAUD|nr:MULTISPECIES: baseplate J/gp47 family protein [unclassified Pseudomonas]ASN71468.1 putative baseplate assembly protein [uncultured Caudovirales phage]MQT44287.1 baseplate assembly protein [Pseudomonas sp. FSL R10-0765]MQU03452.1 baseplate assembly protein [Pseudomonas sp. FSL R10-2245]